MDLKDKIVGMAKNAIPQQTAIEVKPEQMVEPSEMINNDLDGFKIMMSVLFNSRVQSHIYHLQVTGTGSFAAHLALGTYYETIPGLIDSLIESYQGKHGIITGYKNFEYKDFTSVQDLVAYFSELESIIEVNRASVKESYIQNQIDGVVELINSTLYKLKNLQ